MAVFLLDTFTITTGQSITAHTGETGATWTGTNNAFIGTGDSGLLGLLERADISEDDGAFRASVIAYPKIDPRFIEKEL